ncbi:MAG: ATP-binding protein, partial [Verrucomicrobiota bacterium]|nr:ATP-binding protein [Verrucomicrobiota bacterium]
PISYGQMVLMMPVVLFLMLIPITINGHGLRELLLISYFRYLGIVVSGSSDISVQDTAVALSLVAVANDLLWSLPGGLFYLIKFRVRPGAT